MNGALGRGLLRSYGERERERERCDPNENKGKGHWQGPLVV